MSVIFFWLFIGLAVLLILSIIPGINLLVKPLTGAVFGLFGIGGEGSGSWVVWASKGLVRSHVFFLRNLFLSAKSLDPTSEMTDEPK